MSVSIKQKIVAIALKSNENRNRILRFKWTDMWSVQSPPKIRINEDHFSSCSCFRNNVKVSCLCPIVTLFHCWKRSACVFSYFFGFGPVGVNDIHQIHETGGGKRWWEKENNFMMPSENKTKPSTSLLAEILGKRPMLHNAMCWTVLFLVVSIRLPINSISLPRAEFMSAPNSNLRTSH